MLKTVEISRANKTKGVAVTYRAGKGEKYATCPTTCKMNCSGKGTKKIDHDYLDALLKAKPKKVFLLLIAISIQTFLVGAKN